MGKIEIWEDKSGIYRTLILEVTLSRKMSFTTLAILIPCQMLTLLTLAIFLLPDNSAAKLELGVAIWTSLVVFLLILVALIPGSSAKMPLVGLHIMTILIIVTESLLLAVISTSLHAQKKPFSMWLQHLVFKCNRKGHFAKMEESHTITSDKNEKKPTNLGPKIDDNTVHFGTDKHLTVSLISTGIYDYVNYKYEQSDQEKNQSKARILVTNEEICENFDYLCIWLQLISFVVIVLFEITYYNM